MASKKTASSPSSSRAPMGSTLSRYVSFVMLVVTILVCGFYFYNVIKGFLLPLFLAVLLAVIFRPFHHFVTLRVPKRPAVAAAISTSAIMLIVLVPMAGLLALGLYEGNQVIRDRQVYLAKASEIRESLGLRKPFAESLDRIDAELRQVDEAFQQSATPASLRKLMQESGDEILEQLKLIKRVARDAAMKMRGELAEQPEGAFLNRYDEAVMEAERAKPAAPAVDGASGQRARLPDAERREIRDRLLETTDISLSEAQYAIALDALRDELVESVTGALGPELGAVDRTPEKRSLRYLVQRSIERPETGFLPMLDLLQQRVVAWTDKSVEENRLEQRQALTDVRADYVELRTGLFGGPIWKWGLELLNPSNQEVNEWMVRTVAGGATRWLPSITNTATSLIVGLLVGLGIMAVALFYFFMDGPKMINSFMHLSPLDDRHELELLTEFDKVSRAVVLATLLSALAQGVLGGIGYKLVGMQSVFLLTLLTTVLALIPFVGAAAIWVPCCLYIAFIQEPLAGESRAWLYGKAAFLAVYGMGVISMADNIIKPWVLQGQSKLHPLLALLSVLGGVQALGPIGILVGPMVVAFLQVLLTILQREITSLDEEMKRSSDAAK